MTLSRASDPACAILPRNEGDASEELYNLRDDPSELTNLAGRHTLEPALQRFRELLARAKSSKTSAPVP